MTATPIAHGGDIAAAELRWGKPEAGWLDLSTGINPVPYPVPALAADSWHRLPQADGLAALLDAARRFYRADPAAAIVAAPGTQALIQLLPRLRPASRVAVLGPTYAEHAAAWAAAGHVVREVGAPADLAQADVAVVVNPNNPDGRRTPPGMLLDLAATLDRRGGLLVVDEAFAEVAPEVSVADAAGRPGLVVLRSFGKLFGLAGLRLGFALAAAEVVERLAAMLGPWAVAGPAIEIGRAALSDVAWAEATRRRLAVDAQRLDAILTAAGLEPLGGTDLFRLVATAGAAALRDHLGRFGILVRGFEHSRDRLRFGLPADDAGFDRLRGALASWRA